MLHACYVGIELPLIKIYKRLTRLQQNCTNRQDFYRSWRQELKRAPGYFTLIGDNAPPAVCDSSESV